MRPIPSPASVSMRAAVLATMIALPPTGVRPARADEAHPVGGLAVNVTKATTACFSSVVRTTGYVVPRATAVVMFNAAGFRIVEVSKQAGDSIKSGDQMAVAVPTGPHPDDKTGPRVSIKTLASGLVLSRTVDVGMPTAAEGGPLFTLAVDGEMEALVDIPSVHVLEVAAGQTAHVATDDGGEFSGHVRLVPVEIDKFDQFGQARVSIDGAQGLPVGRFVRVAIDAGRSCGLAVPLAALTHGRDGITLQVVTDGVIATRRVALGLSSDTDTEIIKGLADGDLVVSDAGTALQDGDKVKPILTDLQDGR